MKSVNVIKTCILAVAMLAMAGVMAVLACGPTAAPEQQSGDVEGAAGSVSASATEAPFVLQQSGDGGQAEPTPTTTPVCWEVPVYGGGTRIGCEEPGPPGTSFDLRMAIKEHKAQSASRARGESVEPVTVDVSIFLETEAVAYRLLEFLETNARDADWDVSWHGGDWWAVDVWVFRLDAGLVETVLEMEGVLKMESLHPLKENGNRLQQRQEPAVAPTLTAAQITHADQWHAAGITGSGVGVGVIDSSFQDFETRVLPMLSRPVRFFCYDASGNIVEGQLPSLPDGASFDVCEDGSLGNPDHGTDAAAALAEIAPDVDLYIAEVEAGSGSVQRVFRPWTGLLMPRGL